VAGNAPASLGNPTKGKDKGIIGRLSNILLQKDTSKGRLNEYSTQKHSSGMLKEISIQVAEKLLPMDRMWKWQRKPKGL
jgi:hypothetical protein